MVVRSREDTQIVGTSDRSGVKRSRVSDSGGIVCDSSLLDIVPSGATDQETVLSNDSVDVGRRAFEEIKEGSAVEVGLLEMDVELCAGLLGIREEVA